MAKKNYVWVVVCDWMFKGEGESSVEIYSTREGALKYMQKDFEEAKIGLSDWFDTTEIDLDNGYITIYEDGDYGYNHITYNMEKKEVFE